MFLLQVPGKEAEASSGGQLSGRGWRSCLTAGSRLLSVGPAEAVGGPELTAGRMRSGQGLPWGREHPAPHSDRLPTTPSARQVP